MDKIKIGFAMCGSFCTFEKVLCELELLAEHYDITPLLSPISCERDSRFMARDEVFARLEDITGKTPITTIHEAEPVGPKKLFDAMVIAPCTGNTVAKLANGVTDTTVTMAAKAHLRNERPLIVAVSTNDGLSANAKNIGALLNTKNIYFVPFGQDDAIVKKRSLVSNFHLIDATVQAALKGEQIQPILI